ncbi:hypothetical protein [Candidatus Deianiraea vastatrix]|uniref:Uncharacterized protein n=1 Tax=Candidatus Deianiraea vastatrix TaxID=2163644 RepID=A0A5B8XET7_9RICK|nr:hypothetical protein [Candidatus Deianiraea vastatrix]QED23405.1 hypothetical protein Deia_00611 [Candidatus Deianiraea vastatrix]
MLLYYFCDTINFIAIIIMLLVFCSACDTDNAKGLHQSAKINIYIAIISSALHLYNYYYIKKITLASLIKLSLSIAISAAVFSVIIEILAIYLIDEDCKSTKVVKIKKIIHSKDSIGRVDNYTQPKDKNNEYIPDIFDSITSDIMYFSAKTQNDSKILDSIGNKIGKK